MYSMILAIRRDVEGWFVEGETSEPALAAGTRVSAPLKLDVHGAGQLPVRDLGELREYGEMLGKALFVGDVRAAFHEVLSRLPQGDVLHVSLSVEDAELRSLHWERLCCPLHNRKDSPWEFLHLRQETAYSLDLRSPNGRRYPAISRVGLKALVVVADMGPTRPYKLAEFDSAKTVAGIRAALGEEIPCHVLASSGASQLPDTDGLPTLDEICRWLARERFAILHLVCHGEFKQWEEPGSDEKPKSKSDTFLYLRKSGAIDSTRKDDHVVRISGTEFLQRLSQCQALPHLTFLCSCSSASAEGEQGLGGLGQRLVRELAMPSVVAMTEPVPIDLATEISAAFYDQLRRTGEVDRALTKASAGQAGNKAVLVPTHFSRLAGRRLFDDSMELTTVEWEHGLNRLPALIQERAPVLATTFDKVLKVVQPVLEIWKVGELSTSEKRTSDETWARDTLQGQKGNLNELCQDFLENSFYHLAKDKPLAFPTYDGRCPFPGLGVFDKVKTGEKEEDFRPFFFGREELTREIRELLTRNRFVAVLGGSGSGKSSLVRAGLLEAMRREKPELQAIVFPPGENPLVRLQTELAAAPNPDILVVDQFEESFTLCTDLTQRKEFLKQLLPLKDRIPIVITMRADFLGECAGHDDLHQLLDAADDKHLKLIQPLKGIELRSDVELQAQAVGLRFEPGLAASMFDDLEGEPGAMPLLQHCLRQLWQHRHGRWLRLVEYANEDRVGGVKGAISRTAEDVYQQLVKDEPEAASLLPFIFERLARLDTSTTDPGQRRDTRRREELTELTPAGSNPQVVKLIVTKLADAKLIVTTQNPQTHETEVEVAHEALIRNWPRLQKWLDAARDTARLVERIRNDAATYSTTPTSDNLTLRGAVLAEAETLLPKVPRRLNESEEHFVRDCRKHETTLKNAEDRRRTRIIIVLACGLAVAIGLGITAYRQRNSAIRLANDNGTLATQNKTLATTNGQLAETERLLRTEAERQTRLVEEKVVIARNAATTARLTLTQSLQRQNQFREANNTFLSVNAEDRDAAWGLLNARVAQPWSRLKGHSVTPMKLKFSPNGSLLASGGGGMRLGAAYQDPAPDFTVIIWDMTLCKPKGAPLKGHRSDICSIAFSDDGQHLATGAFDGEIRIWDLTSLNCIHSLPAIELFATSLVFSQDGNTLISGHAAGSEKNSLIQVWDVATGVPLGDPITPLQFYEPTPNSFIPLFQVFDFSLGADGTTLAVAVGGTIQVVDLSERKLLYQIPMTDSGFCSTVAFQPNRDPSERLAYIETRLEESHVVVWDHQKRSKVISAPTGHEKKADHLVFAPSGDYFATLSRDGTARRWNAFDAKPLGDPLRWHAGGVSALTFHPSGLIAASAASDESSISLWALSTETSEYRGFSDQGWDSNITGPIVTSPDSKLVAAGYDDGAVHIASLSTGRTYLQPLLGHRGQITSISFSPSSKRLAVCSKPLSTMQFSSISHPSDTGEVVVWDLNHGDRLYTCSNKDIDTSFIAFTDSDRSACVVTGDGALYNLNVESSIFRKEASLEKNERASSFSVSEDRSIAVVGTAFGSVAICDLTTRPRRFELLPEMNGGVFRVAFTPDSKALIAASNNGTIAFYDLKSRQKYEEPLRVDRLSDIAISRDGS